MAGILFAFLDIENNVYWISACVFNIVLVLIALKRAIPVTPLFLLSVYYMYWAMIHASAGSGTNLTDEGKRMELITAILAFLAFFTTGWLYYSNRNRW